MKMVKEKCEKARVLTLGPIPLRRGYGMPEAWLELIAGIQTPQKDKGCVKFIYANLKARPDSHRSLWLSGRISGASLLLFINSLSNFGKIKSWTPKNVVWKHRKDLWEKHATYRAKWQRKELTGLFEDYDKQVERLALRWGKREEKLQKEREAEQLKSKRRLKKLERDAGKQSYVIEKMKRKGFWKE